MEVYHLKKTHTPYTSKQPLVMAYEGSESARDNFGRFIYQFQPETKTLSRKLERILNKLYRQNLSLSFNEICLNERRLPNYIYIYIYIYIYTYTHISDLLSTFFNKCLVWFSGISTIIGYLIPNPFLHYSDYCPHLGHYIYHNVSAVVRSGLLRVVGISNLTLYFAYQVRLF